MNSIKDTPRALSRVVVEEPFPRGGGLGHHPTHIENDGVELLSSQNDGLRFAHG